MKQEESHQIALADYLDRLKVKTKRRRLLWCHVPNGGSRNIIEATKLKRMGVKRGVLDVLIFDPPTVLDQKNIPIYLSGMAIELKHGKNKPTQYQEMWLTDLIHRDWLTFVSYSIDDSIKLIQKYYSHLL